MDINVKKISKRTLFAGLLFGTVCLSGSGTITDITSTSSSIGSLSKNIQKTPSSLISTGNRISSYTNKSDIVGKIGGALTSIGEDIKPLTDTLSNVSDAADIMSEFSDVIDSISSLFGSSSSPSVTASVQSIIDAIGQINHDLDGLFSATNLSTIEDQINQISTLASCFGLDFSTGLNGLCSNLGGLGIGGLGDSEVSSFLRCVGIDIGGLGNIGVDLSSLCDGSAADQVEEAIQNGGFVGGDGDNDSRSGGWNTNPLNLPTTYGYNPLNVVSTSTVELDSVGNGTEKDEGTKTEDIKYPSKKTGKELYSEDGGLFAKKGKTKPRSSDGRAWLEVDNTTLLLKDMAFKTLGTTEESASPLPANIADARDKENDVAKLNVASFIDFNDVALSIAKNASTSYKNIEADTVSAYFSKEYEEFSKITEGEDIKHLYKMAEKYVSMKYSSRLFIAQATKHYGREPVYDTSQERLRYVSSELKNEYIMSSLIQMMENTRIKTQALKEKRLTKELLDITLERAYIRSSVFPAGVAEKEIDELLSAVDRAIE